VSEDSVYRKSQLPIIPLLLLQNTRDTHKTIMISFSLSACGCVNFGNDRQLAMYNPEAKPNSFTLSVSVCQSGSRDGAYERTEEIVSSHSARKRKWQQTLLPLQCFFLFSLFWRISTTWRGKKGRCKMYKGVFFLINKRAQVPTCEGKNSKVVKLKEESLFFLLPHPHPHLLAPLAKYG